MTGSYVIYTGSHTNDLTAIQGKLVDLEPGALRGLRPDLDQFAEVTLELAQSYPTAGTAAGIPDDVYEHFLMCNSTVETIEEKLAVAQKQVEVLEESRAFYVDARQNDIGLMVDAMRSRAQRRKDSSILSPFERTIAYNGQIGDKAAKTRRQNAEKREQEGTEELKLGQDEQDKLEQYKAELYAKFEQAVTEAVEKKIAEMKTQPPVV